MKTFILSKTIFYTFAVLTLMLFGAVKSEAAIYEEANMRMVIDKETFLDPDYLDIEIVMEAPVSSYNAVMGVINYDPSYLIIEQTEIDKSFCTLVVPNLPSESEGRKTIICGNPHANASSTMALARIRFKKINAGWTSVNLDDSRMLSADGLANDILYSNENHQILIEK